MVGGIGMSDLTYSRVGDYKLPDLCLPEQETRFIGKYGLLRKRYLKTYRKIIYINLLTAGTLHSHLAEIDEQARDRLELIMKQMSAAQGVTEELKANDQMLWVGVTNNIKACAEEIILKEIVYI